MTVSFLEANHLTRWSFPAIDPEQDESFQAWWAQARHLVVALAHLPLFDGSPEFAGEAPPGPDLIATL